MSNLFVKQTEEVEIKGFLYFDPFYPLSFTMDTKEAVKDHINKINEALQGNPDDPNSDNTKKVDFKEDCIYELDLLFRKPNHADITIMQSDCTTVTEGSAHIDLYRYNDLRFRTLLKKWNFLDEEGNKMPLNNDSINKIHPSVYNELILRMNLKIPLYL